ncbi:hypothetical protein [Microvirga vignae]|nr:hypothetical protein [Microvirga vignae]
MNDANADFRARIKDTEMELDRFERQVGIAVIVTLAIAAAGYAILFQVLP